MYDALITIKYTVRRNQKVARSLSDKDRYHDIETYFPIEKSANVRDYAHVSDSIPFYYLYGKPHYQFCGQTTPNT